MPRGRIRVMACVSIVASLLGGCLATPVPPADLETPDSSLPQPMPEWGPPGEQVRPGSLAVNVGRALAIGSGGGLCTLNFLFTDDVGLYFGTAAHCLGHHPQMNSSVIVGGEFLRTDMTARLVYHSWTADGIDPAAFNDRCNSNAAVVLDDSRLCWNDFALLEIAPENWTRVHPAMRIVGTMGEGPVTATAGDMVLTVGSSHRRANTEGALDARQGVVVDVGQRHAMVQLSAPSMDGDSGSPVVDSENRPLGVMIYWHFTPPSANGVALLGPLLDAAAEHGFSVTPIAYA